VGELMQEEAELGQVRIRDGERSERLERLARELIATAESLRRAAQDAKTAALDVGADARVTAVSLQALREELDALPFMESEPFGALRTPVGEGYGFDTREKLADAESGYVAFENVFRGSSQRLTRSQEPYMPLLAGHAPVLDV